MSLFAAWTSVVLGAARIDLPAVLTPTVPEPRGFRLAYNPVPPAAPAPAPAPARRLVAEPAPVSTRTPLPIAAGRLCLEK
ncbi:hypothetical protein [Azospirillum sp. TSH100]|uniref:hypothetical protein n=1 Tax=Azospirillum sp. TSH100 TaxID=652764 RepID=UPI0010A9AC81|nr:hypothetical protein [Azospirillum sp. TSH100]QCG87270.1 hypothetical protein E6C72_05720 [Azospirillum sp. TSH100]